jgi:hypothetical protein
MVGYIKSSSSVYNVVFSNLPECQFYDGEDSSLFVKCYFFFLISFWPLLPTNYRGRGLSLHLSHLVTHAHLVELPLTRDGLEAETSNTLKLTRRKTDGSFGMCTRYDHVIGNR